VSTPDKPPAHRRETEIPADVYRREIAQRVLAHFRQNVQAMDSVEGIARFWIGEKRDVVERCLNDLYERGLLARRNIAGTDFYSLPRSSAKEEHRPVTEPSDTERQSSENSSSVRGRLLVADDDPNVRDLLVSILSDAGYSVREAENGERALESFRAEPCDVVVTDLQMPGISGIEVLQALKKHSPSTEVILITGHASLETTLMALRSGAYDLLTKPFEDIDALPRVVERAIEKRHLSRENNLLVENLRTKNLELKDTVARLAAVNEISRTTTGLLDLGELYDSLVRLIAQHLKARRVSVLVSEPDSDTMSVVASVGINDKGILKQQVRVGEGIAGRVAASEAPLLVANIEESELRELRARSKYATPSFMSTPLMVTYPIRYQRRRVGVINVSDKHSGDPFTEQDLEFLSTLASQAAVAIENARLVKETQSGYISALASIIRSIEDARPKTRGHSRRVAELASRVAREMGLPEGRSERLLQAAVLHEAGRIAPKNGTGVRRKKIRGVGDEWTTAAGVAAEKVLAPIASLQPVREIILRSADPFEADAIPGATSNQQIPLESRILAACEEFVRLTPGNGTQRDKVQKALGAIQQDSGKKYDPDVVAALCRGMEGEGSK
jgi:response regulator RpfG family c-di-GMP phosphodiesterase